MIYLKTLGLNSQDHNFENVPSIDLYGDIEYLQLFKKFEIIQVILKIDTIALIFNKV